jgi:NADPH-dependent glutamate synthase beta subunit-like oxidoreductase
VPGNTLAGIFPSLAFLEAVNSGREISIGKRVVVIGGGSVAMDAAMTALRAGASEVHVASLEALANMSASREELDDATAEGIVLHKSWGVEAFLGDTSVTGVKLIACTSVFDQEGRFCPVCDGAISKNLQADTVIVAIGQKPDAGCLSFAAGAISQGGRIGADPNTFATAYPGVFAGGDVVTGSGTVVEAAWAGKEAAESIDRYLRKIPLARAPGEESYGPFFKGCSGCEDPEKTIKKEGSLRAVPVKQDAAARIRDFREIVCVLTEEQAIKEARRCLKYDLDLAEKSAARLKNAGSAAFDFKRVTGKEW